MRPNTPGFVGAKLREAREARALTGITLAGLLGVTRQAISSYEVGDKSPSPEVMDELSKILKLPLSFFLTKSKDENEFDDSPIFYRSMSAATKAARIKAETRYRWLGGITAYLSDFVDFPDVNLPKFDVPSDPVELSNETIEELASKTRRYWRLGEGPISNIVWLLENNGVIVGRYSLEADTLDAFSQWQKERPFIILGADKGSVARSRFDTAHELGHLILHRNIFPKSLNRPTCFNLMEEQAHRFAGAFLFPQNAFAEETLLLNLDLLRSLKPRWKLSIAMMIKRVEHLSFISQEEAQNMWRNYTRRGWKKREPLDNELPIEAPQLLRKAFELIIEQRLQAYSDVLSRLKLHHYEIEELAGLNPNYLNESVAEVIELLPRKAEHTDDPIIIKSGDLIHFPSNKKIRN